MADIINIIKKLSTYTRIDFSGKESEMDMLAKKYDKNMNSIFESEELQAMKDDLQEYAKSDDNAEDLNEDEAGNFLKAILPEGQFLAELLNRTGRLAEDYIANMFNNLNLVGIDNDKDGFIKNKIKELEGKRDFNEDFIERLSELDAKQLDNAVQLLFVEGRTEQLSIQDICDLARIDDDRFERAKILLNTTYGDENKEFQGWEIAELAKLTNEELERAITLCNTKEILDRFECVTNIAPLATLTEEQFERAETLFNIESRGEKQFNGAEIADLSKLKEEQFERAKTLFNIESRGKNQFNGYEIAELAKLKSKQFKRAKTLFNTTYGDENKKLDGYQIDTLAQLTDKQLERAISLLNTKDIIEQFESVYDIAGLAKLTDLQLERAKTLYNLKIRGGNLNIFEITQLSKLSEKQFEHAKTLLDAADETNQYSCADIYVISKLKKDEFERAKTFLHIEGRKKQLNGPEISMLVQTLTDEQIEISKEFMYVVNREEQFSGNEIAALSLLKDEQLERAKSLLFVEGREKQFSGGEICMLVSLPEDKYERVKDLIYVASRNTNQLNGSEITTLAKLSDEEYEHAKELIYVENREENQFNGMEITALAKLSKKDLKRAKSLINNPNNRFNGINIADMTQFSMKEYKQAKELIYVESRGEKQFDGADIVSLAKLSKDEFERAKTLFNIESRGEKQFCGFEIASLAKLSEEEFERATTLFNVESRGDKQFNGTDIVGLAKLSEEELERAKTLFNIESRGENQFSGDAIVELAKLSKEEFERAKSLLYVDNREEQFTSYEIAAFSKLSEDELERARSLFNLPDRNSQLSADAIAELVKLPEDKYTQAEKLLSIEEREFDYAKDIVMLTELTDEEISSVSEYMSDWHFSSYNLFLMAKNNSEELKQYLDEIPNPEIVYTAGNSIKFRNEDKFYTYDKTGLIETGEEQKIPDTEYIKNGTLTTYMNTKLNVKHEILEGEIPNTKDLKTVLEETLTFYDNDGNVIRTLTMKRNPSNGTLNVSETDKNGKQIPIQWESIDPNTGANITERHLVSPEGVKTDFYCEENDEIKITDYLITDNAGNELINIHQTFEQKSDNIFISSINTTGKPEDTRIYKMKYTKDGKVKIFDKNNKKNTIIDLKKYITDEISMENLLPILKQLPGQVLLEFEEKPLTMGYMENIPNNGFWAPLSNSLMMGNFDDTTGKENNLLAVITHELGHYLDLYSTSETSSTINIMDASSTMNSKFANNPEITAIFKEEFNAFIEKTTTAQQKHIDYFTSPEWQGQAKERVAETHSLLYSKDGPIVNTRRLYLAEYFPRTIAAIMKLLLEEEGIK